MRETRGASPEKSLRESKTQVWEWNVKCPSKEVPKCEAVTNTSNLNLIGQFQNDLVGGGGELGRKENYQDKEEILRSAFALL